MRLFGKLEHDHPVMELDPFFPKDEIRFDCKANQK